MKSCCDFHSDIECNGGRNCPSRKPSTIWCETSRQPCTQPYTCASGCEIKAYNATYDPVYEWELTPMGWCILAGLASWLAAVSVYFYFF